MDRTCRFWRPREATRLRNCSRDSASMLFTSSSIRNSLRESQRTRDRKAAIEKGRLLSILQTPRPPVTRVSLFLPGRLDRRIHGEPRAPLGCHTLYTRASTVVTCSTLPPARAAEGGPAVDIRTEPHPPLTLFAAPHVPPICMCSDWTCSMQRAPETWDHDAKQATEDKV